MQATLNLPSLYFPQMVMPCLDSDKIMHCYVTLSVACEFRSFRTMSAWMRTTATARVKSAAKTHLLQTPKTDTKKGSCCPNILSSRDVLKHIKDNLTR